MDGVGIIMVCYQYILVALDGCNWEPSCLVHIIFLVMSNVLRKTRLVSYDCTDGVNWYCSGSGSDCITF